jgi:hypothetical protein
MIDRAETVVQRGLWFGLSEKNVDKRLGETWSAGRESG